MPQADQSDLMSMEFRIADTFTDSLARLTGDEQKAVKTTAFDLQLNPANPGMSFHKLDKAKDKNFWSVRVSSDIRLIVHKSEASLLLCYVDHHDKAYDWAERRKLETHPKTGAAQLVEIRETVQEIVVPSYVKRNCRHRNAKTKLSSPTVQTTSCSAMACPPSGWTMSRSRRGHALATCRPPAARSGRGAAGTGDRRQAATCNAGRCSRRSLRASRRAAPLPGHGQCRGIAARARFPVGEMDGLSASRHSGNWWNATTPGRRASPALPAPARPSWPLHRAVLSGAHESRRAVLLTTFSDTWRMRCAPS